MDENEVQELARAFEERDTKVVEALAGLKTGQESLKEVVADLQQKMVQRGSHPGTRPDACETLGRQFVKSLEGRSRMGDEFARDKAARHAFMTKTTITTATTDTSGAAGAAVPTFTDAIIALPRRRLFLRDLLPVSRVDTQVIEFPRMTERRNNAGMVAEGAAKPQSDIKLELVQERTKVIAHHMKASRQILDDVSQMADFIDTELRWGLALKEETQLLSGDGTGQNLLGIIPRATAFSAPFSIGSATMIDTIGLALLQSSLAEHPASGIVLHPSDWMKMRLLKKTDGGYLLGDPNTVPPPVLFGKPVVETPAMTAGKFLVGDFQGGAKVYDRWEARVEVATQNEDDFIKNLVTFLCEERLAFAVFHGSAFTYGDF